MKIIKTGSTFDVFGDGLEVLKNLPPDPYIVRFSKDTGFHLERYSDIEIKESKIYGVHEQKVNKVLQAFDDMNRNLGVILSGDKGIGKSLFTTLLAVESIKRGLPVIIVNTYIGGIADYLDSIQQPVVVLFDEFDKTFASISASSGKAQAQTEMLTLFDGLAQGRKMFVITCNSLKNLDEYLLNRPGRFHYHFRFDYPTAQEIRCYLEDKLDPQYYGEIDDVVFFSRSVKLNYDCLRAIAFELNRGDAFKEAINDLNILNMKNTNNDLFVHYSNGVVLTNIYSLSCNPFSSGVFEIDLYNKTDRKRGTDHVATISFDSDDICFDQQTQEMVLPVDKVCIRFSYEMFCDDDDMLTEVDKKFMEMMKDAKVTSIVLKTLAAPNYRFFG